MPQGLQLCGMFGSTSGVQQRTCMRCDIRREDAGEPGTPGGTVRRTKALHEQIRDEYAHLLRTMSKTKAQEFLRCHSVRHSPNPLEHDAIGDQEHGVYGATPPGTIERMNRWHLTPNTTPPTTALIPTNYT